MKSQHHDEKTMSADEKVKELTPRSNRALKKQSTDNILQDNFQFQEQSASTSIFEAHRLLSGPEDLAEDQKLPELVKEQVTPEPNPQVVTITPISANYMQKSPSAAPALSGNAVDNSLNRRNSGHTMEKSPNRKNSDSSKKQTVISSGLNKPINYQNSILESFYTEDMDNDIAKEDLDAIN